MNISYLCVQENVETSGDWKNSSFKNNIKTILLAKTFMLVIADY